MAPMSETTTVVRRGKTPEQMREYKRLKALEYRDRNRKAIQAAASAVSAAAAVAAVVQPPPEPVSTTIPEEIRAKIDKLPAPYQLRFTKLYDDWQNNKATKRGVSDLEQAGIIERIVVDGEHDTINGGQQAVADWISIEYPAVQVSRRHLINWLHGKHLPKGCTTPYPAPVRGHHLKSLGRQWIERFLVDRTIVNGVNVDTVYLASPSEREAAAVADIAEMKRDDLKRRMDRDWMMAAAHEFTMASVGTVARNTVRDAMEKLLPDEMERALTELVPDADLRARILARLRTVAAAGTDEWQATFCRRLASLDEECQKNSMEEKEKR